MIALHVRQRATDKERKGFSKLVLRQDTDTFLRCLENGLRGFSLVKPSLKRRFATPDWFDPDINPSWPTLAVWKWGGISGYQFGNVEGSS